MKNVTKFWFLEGFNLMKKMGKSELMKLCDILEMKSIQKGEELMFKRDDKEIVFFLKSGTVKIVSRANNHTKYIVKKGNIFGELSLLNDDNVEEDRAVVLEGGLVCFIEAVLMRELMEKHASLKNGILKLNGFKIKKLERKLENLLYKDSRARIEEYLFDYISEFGIKNGSKIEAKNLLSHSDIANLTNTSRQTVNNVMSTLRKDGIINYDSKKIYLIINSEAEFSSQSSLSEDRKIGLERI